MPLFVQLTVGLPAGDNVSGVGASSKGRGEGVTLGSGVTGKSSSKSPSTRIPLEGASEVEDDESRISTGLASLPGSAFIVVRAVAMPAGSIGAFTLQISAVHAQGFRLQNLQA